jgi:hypothetical protein
VVVAAMLSGGGLQLRLRGWGDHDVRIGAMPTTNLQPGRFGEKNGGGRGSRRLARQLGLDLTEVSHREFELRDKGSPFQIAFVPVEVVGEPVCKEHIALHWGSVEKMRRAPWRR